MGVILERIDAEGGKVYRINKRQRKGFYYIRPDSSQAKLCKKVRLLGFDRLPTGFYTDKGWGLVGVGFYLLRELQSHFNKRLDITITADGQAEIPSTISPVKIVIPHKDLALANQAVSVVKRRKNDQIFAVAKGLLAKLYPNEFEHFQGFKVGYAPGSLASILAQKEILTGLSTEDRATLEEFIPEYLSSIQATLRSKKKLKVVFDSIEAVNKVYWSEVVREFNRKLKREVKSEQSWQNFLSSHILLLRSSYGEVLEKESVSLQGKFPDFMLIDSYSYVDVYEIKTPYTRILSYDKSRNNYYWNSEISKAISQVENYLYQVQRHGESFMNDIRKNKGIEVSIVRPRGYIIAGLRDQLTTAKMLDDFRILNESLKNVDVILYDDLLANLEAFAERMAGTEAATDL